MGSKITVQDIARRAGVGVGTVSRVLNGSSEVRPETREHVLHVIEELGYRPNFAARLLRTHRSNFIGFITDEIAITPFSVAIIQGAQDQAWTSDKVLLVVNTGENADLERTAVKILLERQVEGIIYAAMKHKLVSPPAELCQIPVVLVDCYSDGCKFPSIVPDEVAGGYTATEALLRKGHRRIGFINLEMGVPASSGRLQGYREALEAYGVPFDESLIRYGHGSFPNTGYQHALSLMKEPNPPTGLFCGNDRIAMGVYDALRELGMAIPRDAAVVGFDNMEVIAANLRPPLSTVQLPHYEMGQWAVNYLVEHLDSPEIEPVQVKIFCPFIERASI